MICSYLDYRYTIIYVYAHIIHMYLHLYVYTYMYGPHASWILDPFQDLPSPEAGEASTAQPGAHRWRGADTWYSAAVHAGSWRCL